MYYICIFIFSDFCKEHDGHIRGGNSLCHRPRGDNARRTGLVVVSFLSSVLVLVVWIIHVPLWRCVVISEINKYVLSVHTHT